jgi:integrase/recombinase XerD
VVRRGAGSSEHAVGGGLRPAGVFRIVAKEPEQVTTGDMLAFIADQRQPRRGDNVVRLEDGEAGLSARTIKRRLSSLSGLFTYLVARDDVGVAANPVPRGLATRRSTPRRRGVPLVRAPRTLPKLLEPDEVDRLLAVLRTRRDRAMVEAMLLGGLHRCEVLGLRFDDVRPGEHRLFIAEGKGGHQRLIPVPSERSHHVPPKASAGCTVTARRSPAMLATSPTTTTTIPSCA